MKQLKVGIVQMDVQRGKPIDNVERAERLINAAVEAGAEVLLLPELWSTGFDLPQLNDMLSRQNPDPNIFLAEKAKQHAVWIVGGSVAVKDDDGRIYNSAPVFHPDGNLVTAYRKIHLFGLMDEDQYLSAGNEPVNFRLGEWPAGLIICYDLRFPELSRLLTLRGAQIIFVPAQWPTPRLEHWRVLLQARAIENQCFVVSCNTVGQKGKDHFPGHSLVVDPWGRIVYEAGDEETVAVVELDGEEVNRVRRTMSVLTDRRPDCYS